ncbi:MAG: MbtH family NRPS accessory protein [Hyphomonadaceae bacterium]
MTRNTLFAVLILVGIALAPVARAQDAWEQEDKTIYAVVVNHEEQYSIWPADRELPLGWKKEGKIGTKQECLDHIEEVWTDMRPLSLRKKMEEAAATARE